jgi:hypothetical protein
VVQLYSVRHSGDMARIRDIAPVICRGFVIFEVRHAKVSKWPLAPPQPPCYALRQASRGTRMVYDLTFLTESGSGKRIAINPHLVRFVIEINDKTVAIVFDQLHQINVDGTVASISEHLRKTVR